jgi:hypothetical protein
MRRRHRGPQDQRDTVTRDETASQMIEGGISGVGLSGHDRDVSTSVRAGLGSSIARSARRGSYSGGFVTAHWPVGCTGRHGCAGPCAFGAKATLDRRTSRVTIGLTDQSGEFCNGIVFSVASETFVNNRILLEFLFAREP